jgi:hypothetical protein
MPAGEEMKMSSHPNAILAVRFKPNGLARETMREIYAEAGLDEEDQIKIGGDSYTGLVMEGDYDEDYQISGDEGDLIFFDMVTYGYGEEKDWDVVAKQKWNLEEWAKAICIKHDCSFEIFITANYW